MASFTAADVKKLRELTGAGMMDCKKALDEADGDFDAAIDILRTKGAAKAAKRGAEREASAGLVAHAPGVLVELKCETDFVAKGEDFVVAAQQIADAASQAKPADVEALKAVALGDQTVGEVVEVPDALVVDAAGCLVVPGGVDAHTHLDSPQSGTVSTDDFHTGTVAAAFGGTTTIVDFAVQGPGTTLQDTLATWAGKADGRAVVDYGFHVIVTSLGEAELGAVELANWRCWCLRQLRQRTRVGRARRAGRIVN